MNKYNKLVLLFFLFVRQTGSIADCLRKMPEDTTDKGWIAYIMTELADIAILVKRTCEVLDIDYDEIVKLGFERDAEKKEEYIKRHPGAVWI